MNTTLLPQTSMPLLLRLVASLVGATLRLPHQLFLSSYLSWGLNLKLLLVWRDDIRYRVLAQRAENELIPRRPKDRCHHELGETNAKICAPRNARIMHPYRRDTICQADANKSGPAVEANTIEAAVNVPLGRGADPQARACKDCHSNETRWPWYANVAPVSWFVINHVNEGRRHLNFSEWQQPSAPVPPQFARRQRPSACSEVQSGDMPLFSYRLIHTDSRLSPEDIQTFCQWANSAISK